nr:MAG TPA: hypothetical protein [Caudoviricetes sp.]
MLFLPLLQFPAVLPRFACQNHSPLCFHSLPLHHLQF